MKKIIVFLFILFLLPTVIFAFEFGVGTSINTGFGNQSDGDFAFDFSAGLWPHFFMFIGDNGEFVTSVGLSLGIFNEEFFIIPEILNTELTMRFDTSEIRAGRMGYSDPLGFIADGLFDGFQFINYSHLGHFNIGVWYTGLLYKKTANIKMTAQEQTAFYQPVDYGDFINTYFAPRRVVAALGWEYPSLFEFMNLNAALIAQFDVAGDYHSQYLIAKASIPLSRLRLEFGGAVELSQVEEFGLGFAGMFGIYWQIPGTFNSLLSFSGRIAGGGSDELLSPFNPITSKYYGLAFKSKFSGLSIFSLDYSARLLRSLGISAGVLYFVRNDFGTFSGYPVEPDNQGYFLGRNFMLGRFTVHFLIYS